MKSDTVFLCQLQDNAQCCYTTASGCC